MTEEDTFKALSQTPFNDVLRRVWRTDYNLDTPETLEFLTQYGWTYKEFFKIYLKLSSEELFKIVEFV